MRDVRVFGAASDGTGEDMLKDEILSLCPQLAEPLKTLQAAECVFDATNLLERDIGNLRAQARIPVL